MKALFALVLFAAALLAQTAHTVVLTWTDPNNPAGATYNVYRANGACSSNPTFASLVSTPVSGLTFTDTGVTVGQTYCYHITAVIGTVESAPGPNAGATVLPFSPASLQISAK